MNPIAVSISCGCLVIFFGLMSISVAINNLKK